MARYIYQGQTKDQNGKILTSATVSAYLAGTTTLASIYAASAGGAAVNSVVSSSVNGYFSFYVDSTDYVETQLFKVVVSKANYSPVTWDNLTLYPVFLTSTGVTTILYLSNYATFAAAIAAIGASVTTLVLDAARTISINTTVPSTLSIIGTNEGVLTINNGITLTINGAFEAGIYQVFSCVGSGSVVFGFPSKAEPVYPQWWGALADNAHDDTAAIQAAINSRSQTGGIVYFPAGNYYTANGITESNSLYPVRLIGAGDYVGGTFLNCGTNNVTTLTINGYRDTLENMWVSGPGINATSGHNAVTLGSSASKSIIRDCRINGGYHSLSIAAVDFLVENTYCYEAYGSSVVYMTGAGYFIRNTIDQLWPVSLPAAGAFSPAAWTNGHVYTVGTVVSTQGFYLQCSVGGTSAGSAPTLLNYETSITDNTVTWKLVAPTTFYGVQVDTACSWYEETMCDHTGPYTYGLAITNTLAGTIPSNISVSQGCFGECLVGGIYAVAGAGLRVNSSELATFLRAGSVGIYLATGWSGDVSISDNLIFTATYGILLAGGTNTAIGSNNIFGCAGAGIYVSAAVTDFNINGNNAGTSATWGANLVGIQVQTGASDYYNIANNIVHGAGTGVVDGGSGIHKTVSGNN